MARGGTVGTYPRRDDPVVVFQRLVGRDARESGRYAVRKPKALVYDCALKNMLFQLFFLTR